MDKEKGRAGAWEETAVWALGTMSGTSLDGVDAALVRTDGVRIYGFGATNYRAYGANEAAVLRDGLGLWPGEAGVASVADVVTSAHGALLADFEGYDIVGFHGQTLAHDPKGRGTHQAADAAELARKVGRPVVWDFRSADVKAGGEGAPLAPVYHWALAKWIGATQPLVFLNLGGVGNVTWVDPLASDPFAPGALLAFDTGPANAPLNDLVKDRLGRSFDRDGALSGAGTPQTAVIDDLLSDPFFDRVPPKSLDRDAFAKLTDAVSALSDADAAATLVHVIAQTVAQAWRWFPTDPACVLVCGGGRKNPTIMAALDQALPCQVSPVEAVNLDGDMLEAQAFAFLAVRAARGLPLSGPTTTGVTAPCLGGRIAWP
ncbi:MAG: anhydro-N-acetylmuramic acid kinase [Pseudomonadota bacterium]